MYTHVPIHFGGGDILTSLKPWGSHPSCSVVFFLEGTGTQKLTFEEQRGPEKTVDGTGFPQCFSDAVGFHIGALGKRLSWGYGFI